MCCDLILHSTVLRPLAFSGDDIRVYKGAGVTSRKQEGMFYSKIVRETFLIFTTIQSIFLTLSL